MIRAVCFDFDGTLARFTGDFAALLVQLPEALGVGDAAQFLPELSKRLRADGAVSMKSVIGETLMALGLESQASLDTVVANAIKTYTQHLEVLPGAKEMLGYFAALPKAIITNGPSDMQRASIEALGLTPFFKSIVASGDADVAVRKPNPRIFHVACERLGVLPQHVLMIGDSLEQDVHGAIGAGLQALHHK